MFYYSFRYFLVAAAIFLVLALLCLWVPKNRERGRVLAGITGCLTVAFLLSATLSYLGRDEENLAHYQRIMSSEQVTAITGDQRRPVSLELDMDRRYGLGSMKIPPKYAQEADVREICRVEFVKSDMAGSVTVRFCELINYRSYYTKYASFEYEGKRYCFLSERFMYENAFYMMNPDYAAQLIKALLA